MLRRSRTPCIQDGGPVIALRHAEACDFRKFRKLERTISEMRDCVRAVPNNPNKICKTNLSFPIVKFQPLHCLYPVNRIANAIGFVQNGNCI